MRAIATGFAAMLLLLQGLAALGVVRTHPATDGAVAIRVVAQERPCAQDRPSSDPTHDAGENHCPCCPLCDETEGAPLDARAPALRVANLSLLDGLQFSEASPSRLPKGPPIGWVSVWSAQGPPRV